MTTLPPAVIVDVDGTLCDVTSVRHHVLTRPKNFHAFHEGAADCPPHPHVIDWVGRYHDAGHEILVVTGRMEQWWRSTVDWLAHHLPVTHHGPYMREDGDYRPDTVVKREIYDQLAKHYDIRAAIDDNPAIIQLWTDLGLQVETVPGWETETGAHV